MKRFKNLVIGGIENKIFNLVLFTVVLIVLAFALVIGHQARELSRLSAETNEKQQQSMEQISAATMQGVMDATMNKTAILQADVADGMFNETKNDVSMLADYAAKLYADPEAFPCIAMEQPSDFSGKRNVITWLHAEGMDMESEEVLAEAGLLGNLNGMMLSLLDNSEYLGACYIATPSGLTLMCDDATSSKESADVDFVFDSRPRPWYVGACDAKERYFTGIERDYYTDRIGITCSVPVYHNGRLMAVVGGDLFLDNMEKGISDSDSDSGFRFIVDSNGHVIFSPKTDGVFQVLPSSEAPDLRSEEYGALAELVSASLQGNGNVTEVSMDDEIYYMTGAPIHSVGWAEIVVAYRDAVQQPTQMMQSAHQRILDQATEDYRKGIAGSKRFIILLLVLLGLLALLNAIILAKRIVRPLNRMTKRIAVISGENPVFEMSEEYKSGDEVEVLAKSFADLSLRTREYMAENLRITAEKERIGAELNVATKIQTDMLPRIFPPFPERDEFELYASMKAAKEVGGDFYDFFLLDDDHLALVMADVSGKGVPAALFMVIAKTLIKNRAKLGGTPKEILTDVNRQLCESNTSGFFVTVWFAILQISTGKGMAANAAHEHPALRHEGEAFTLVEYKHSPALGMMETIPVREHEFQLQKGDTLFVYTDGVTEASVDPKDLFGEQRMVEALNRNPEASPEEILETMSRQIAEFVGSADQFDDITMLCLKYYGPKG